MNNLHIEPTVKTLKISGEKGLIEFIGCSILDNPIPFFHPVHDWINTYLKDPPQETVVNCKFEYIDTSSFKHIYLLFKELEKINNDCKIVVNWYVEDSDPEILELGEMLDNRVRFKFNFNIT